MKTIRLTESEFKSLIKRIVVETQNEMNGEEIEEGVFGDFGDKVAKAIHGVAEFFKNDVLSDLSDDDKRMIKRKISNVNIENEMDKVDEKEEDMLGEGVITESIGDRLRSFFERLGIGSGIGVSAAGLLGFISNATGWSESELLIKVHDIMQSAGLGQYAGPVSLLIIIAGIALALGSTALRQRRMDN